MHEPVPPFPTEIFGRLGAVIDEYADALKVPRDLAAATALSAASVAVGTAVKLDSGPARLQHGNLWIAYIGPTGTGKDTAGEQMFDPLRAREAEYVRQYNEELAEYEKAHRVWKIHHSVWEKRFKTAIEANKKFTDSEPEEPRRPRLRKLLTTDFTLEAVIKLLHSSPRGILAHQGELVGFLRSMNQYKNGKGSDRALWSDMWNCLPIRKDRATNEERLYVPRPFVSLYGGIQPALLDELDDERSREDGFVYRFLPCFPDRRPTEIPRKIKRSAEKQWNATVEKLFALEPDEDGNPRIAKLDRAAQKEFKRFFTDNAKDVDALDEDDPRRGAWVKLSLYWSRLALVIHLLRWASADRQVDNPMSELVVDGDSALAASILVDDYFKPHLAKVSAVLLAAQAQRLKDRALRYLRAHRGEWTGTRDICHGLNTFKKETEEALSELLDDNLVEFEAKQHHGQTWPRWRVEGN